MPCTPGGAWGGGGAGGGASVGAWVGGGAGSESDFEAVAAALAFLWPMLDVFGRGYLDASTLVSCTLHPCTNQILRRHQSNFSMPAPWYRAPSTMHQCTMHPRRRKHRGTLHRAALNKPLDASTVVPCTVLHSTNPSTRAPWYHAPCTPHQTPPSTRENHGTVHPAPCAMHHAPPST